MQVRRSAKTTLQLLGIALVAGNASWLAAADPAPFNDGQWPFCPPVRPAVPEVEHSAWVANPIDAFILSALEEKGLEPGPPADKLTLLRRVTIDLIGLLPTVDEQEAFLADDSPGAYQRVVDRLLDSPHYGERWAQHWLDVVRYGETDGFKADGLRPTAYRYRDYVIRAFNADLPYDRFICQQLAGDELEPDNPEALVATGLNRLYPDEYNAANVRQRRQEIRDDLTETTGLAFLGLTIGCAQCHDHKFDPILQADYFRLQAFFAPMLPCDDVPLGTAEQKHRYQRELAVWEEATAEIRAEMDSLLASKRKRAMAAGLKKFKPDLRQAVTKSPEERTALEEQLAFQMMKYIAPKLSGLEKGLKGEEKERYTVLKKQLADYDHLKPKPLPVAMTITDAAGSAPPTHRLAGGDYRHPLEEIEPGFPEFLGANQPRILPPVASETSGRRAALARWLCRPDNPLTSRVMVNRLWQHHFAQGLVPTPNDFGAMGQPATHPDLLDYLAVEFVKRGWSLKAMHRLMVTSATYRQSSRVDLDSPQVARAVELDGENQLLWHARRRRLEGEAIRDAILQLAGQLNTRMFGPSARPQLPEGISQSAGWKPDKRAEDRNRRSIYVLAKRNLRYPLLDVFDLPDMHNSCARRPRTTTAPQALALMNGEFTLELARHWSGRLLSKHGADSFALVQAAFAEAFARPAAVDELEMAVRFLKQQAERVDNSDDETSNKLLPIPSAPGVAPAKATAVVDFCHALLNSNELLYVD